MTGTVRPKVMIVDDEEDLSEIFAEMVEDDFETAVYSKAKEALSVLREQHFDVLITDVNMPGMNGVEFVKTLRGEGSKIVIFLLTGQVDTEPETAAALEAGADGYLSKPLGDPESIVEQVMAKLEAKQTADAS